MAQVVPGSSCLINFSEIHPFSPLCWQINVNVTKSRLVSSFRSHLDISQARAGMFSSCLRLNFFTARNKTASLNFKIDLGTLHTWPGLVCLDLAYDWTYPDDVSQGLGTAYLNKSMGLKKFHVNARILSKTNSKQKSNCKNLQGKFCSKKGTFGAGAG